MAKFKAGDKVRCLDALCWARQPGKEDLEVGKVYTVSSASTSEGRDYVALKELLKDWPYHSYFANKFEAVPDEALVKGQFFTPIFRNPASSALHAAPYGNSPMQHTGEGDLKAASQGELFPFIIEKVGDKWYWINHVKGWRGLGYTDQSDAVRSAKYFKNKEPSPYTLNEVKSRYAEHMRSISSVSVALPPVVTPAPTPRTYSVLQHGAAGSQYVEYIVVEHCPDGSIDKVCSYNTRQAAEEYARQLSRADSPPVVKPLAAKEYEFTVQKVDSDGKPWGNVTILRSTNRADLRELRKLLSGPTYNLSAIKDPA